MEETYRKIINLLTSDNMCMSLEPHRNNKGKVFNVRDEIIIPGSNDKTPRTIICFSANRAVTGYYDSYDSICFTPLNEL